MGRHREEEIFNKIKDRFIQLYDIITIHKQHRLPLADMEKILLPKQQLEILNKVISLRADFVAVSITGVYHVIEVKRFLDLEALGQLLGYRILLAEKERVEESRIRCHAVFEKSYERIKDIYRRYNIQLWEVG